MQKVRSIVSKLILANLLLLNSFVASSQATEERQFCLYENPKKPEENLRYRGGRVNYRPNDPGCIIQQSGPLAPGAKALIVWPDGIETRILFATKEKRKQVDPTLSGIATVDGELADWSALEEICLVIRSNGKKICY